MKGILIYNQSFEGSNFFGSRLNSLLRKTDPLKHNPLFEDKLNRYLKKILNQNYFTDDEYENLYASGSNPGMIYGLPKFHKPSIPLRSVL